MRLNPFAIHTDGQRPFAAWKIPAIIVIALTLWVPAQANPVTKAASGTDLNTGLSWAGGNTPTSGDIATWDAATPSLGAGLTLAAGTNWLGIDVQGGATAIAISGAGTLTLGTSGINVASGGVDLTLNNPRTFGATSAINIGAGRTLTLSGGTTTFGAGTTTTLSGPGTNTLAGSSHTITGSGALTIGSGATLKNNLQTGGSSTGYSGAVTLNSGIISISTSISCFGTGTLNLNGGAIGSFNTTPGRVIGTNALNIGGDVQIGGNTANLLSTGALNFGGPVNLGGATRAFDVYANSVLTGYGSGLIFAGVVANGGITLNSTSGSGIMSLTNDANTFAGATTINAGNLAISTGALSNSASVTLNGTGKLSIGINGTTTINNLSGVAGTGIRTDFTISGTAAGRTLAVNQTADGIYAGTFVEGGTRPISLSKSGNAKLTLDGAAAYSGSTLVTAGTLALGASGTLANTPAITVASGAVFDVSLASFSLGASQTLTAGRTASPATDVNGNLTSAGTLRPAGNGTNGTLTLAGDLTLNGGTLSIDVAAANASDTISVSGAVNVFGLTTIQVSAAIPGTYTLISGSSGIVPTNNLQVTGSGALGVAFDNSVSGTLKLVLSPPTAPTLVWDGTLSANVWDLNAANTNWLNGAAPTAFADGDQVKFNGAAAENSVDITAAVSPAAVTVSNASATVSFYGAGSIGGAANILTKGSAGSLVISNINTYGGGTVLNAGALVLANPQAIGSGALTINGGTLDSSVADLVNAGNNAQNWNSDFTFTGTESLNLGTGAVTPNASRQITVASNTLTVGGSIGGGAIGLTKAGAGALALGGANSYSGGTIVSAGELLVGTGANNTASAGTGPVAVNSGTLKFNWASGLNVFTNDISGSGILTRGSTAAEVALSGSNSFNGTIIIPVNTIAVRTLNSAVGAPRVQVLSGGHFALGSDFAGQTCTISELSGDGGVNPQFDSAAGTKTLNINQATTTTYAGVARDATSGSRFLALRKSGTGTLNLDGVNTYTGATTVGNGTLNINGSIASTATLVAGGTLGGVGTIAGTLTVTNGGVLSPGTNGLGTITVNGALTFKTNGAPPVAFIEVDAAAGTSDVIVANGGATYAGSLVVSNLAGSVTNGQSFQVVTGTGTGNFSSITPDPAGDLVWSFNPSSGVLSAVSPIASNPTNITLSVSGGTLTLSWPADHLGWILQAQTNSLATGLGANWVDIDGTAAVTATNVPIDPGNPTVLYRLRHP